MTHKRIFPTVLFLFLSTLSAVAQVSNRITPEEYIEANELSHKFTDRLIRTKDIRPLIREFFVEDFIHKLRSAESGLDFLIIPDDLTKTLSNAELRTIYIEQTNWFYVGLLYYNSKKPVNLDDITDETEIVQKMYPPEIANSILKEPILSRMRASVDDGSTPPTSSDFRYLRKLFRGVTPLLRKYAINTNSGHTSYWHKYVEGDSSLFRPQMLGHDPSYSKLPKNARIITVNIPILRLELVKLNGKMKVLRAAFVIGN